MKIIILHGEDTHKSYERLTKFIDAAKKRNWEILQDNVSVTPSLFGTQSLIIIRDLKLITPKIIKTLDKISGTLVIYSEGNLPATLLKVFPKDSKIERFDIPKIIWKFLDKITAKSLHEVIKTEPIEFVFTMIAWKFKKRYITSPTPETAQIINELAKIDIDAKTGKADLLSSLDLLIVKHLEW